MNRSSFALFVALLIHISLFLLFWLIITHLPQQSLHKKNRERKIKISLKEMPKKYKKSGITKQKIKPTPIAPPMPKGSQLEKIIKKPPIKYIPKKVIKKVRLNKPKKIVKRVHKIKHKIKPLPKREKYIPIVKEQKKYTQKSQKYEKVKEKNPMSWLYKDMSSSQKTQTVVRHSNENSVSNDIKKLYGSEFGKLTTGQQKYILDNQEIMRRITQQILNRVARVNINRDLNVNRSNIVEFKLHPNGDMTDFRFLKKSGYYILDDTTKETIEYAYSQYPRPKETIPVRYNVFYNLRRY